MHAVKDAEREDPQADLERLAAEMTARGYQAHLHTPPGRLPCLDIRNPRASVLAERVYAQAGWFWYSWAERIAGCEDVTGAAGTLARSAAHRRWRPAVSTPPAEPTLADVQRQYPRWRCWRGICGLYYAARADAGPDRTPK